MKYLILVISFFVLCPVCLQARYRMGGGEKPQSVDSHNVSPRGPVKAKRKKISPPKQIGLRKYNEMPTIHHLADTYNVEASELVSLRNLQFGYEELVPAVIIAKAANESVRNVLMFRLDNVSWNNISVKFSLNSDSVNEESNNLLDPLRRVMPQELLNLRPIDRGR